MIFNSLKFGLFFCIVTLLFYIIPYKFRWILLLLGSYFFYACSSPKYIVILFLTTIISYYCGIIMENKVLKYKKKYVLIVSLMVDLGLLFLFKYFNFFTHSFEKIFDFNIPELKWAVPLGISFYTLQTVSYLVDVYREKIKPEKHFGYFAIYVSFFLTIFSGPIDRGTNLLPQIHKNVEFDYDRVKDGILTIVWGLFKKIVIADRLAIYVNQVYNNPYNYRGWPLIIATVFFAIQLYCDFSGYTDMAIGCGKVLGYNLIDNFNLPYISKNVQEFWRRWHISLSSWFRDYLYIPLGGNKVSKFRNYINIIIVFLVSGIWHGASFNFVIWGGLHGFYQVIGKITNSFRQKIERALRINTDSIWYKSYKVIVTFCLVDFAWLFFRANSIKDAKYIVQNLFVNLRNISKNNIVVVSDFKLMIFLILFLFITELYNMKFSVKRTLKRQPIFVRWAIYYLVLIVIIIYSVSGNKQFIYVQF